MTTSLSDQEIRGAAAALDASLARFMKRFPGESGARQPVHTVYGGAQLFKSDTTKKLGVIALRSLDEHGPDPMTFARAIGLQRDEEVVYARVLEKLKRCIARSKSKSSTRLRYWTGSTMRKVASIPSMPRFLMNGM